MKRSVLIIIFLGGFVLGIAAASIFFSFYGEKPLSGSPSPTSKEQSEDMNQTEHIDKDKKPDKQGEFSLAEDGSIILPQPNSESSISVEQAFLLRRSVREYKDEALTAQEISQILWAAQGITAPEKGGRTAPSAGALYPLEVYLVVKDVENIKPGVYHYLPEGHKLKKLFEGDVSKELAQAALGQTFISQAPVAVVLTGVFARTTGKYEERGVQYVFMEAGHAAQNVCLQVHSLGLGTVTVGAFYDEEVKELLKLSADEIPLYVMPVGRVQN